MIGSHWDWLRPPFGWGGASRRARGPGLETEAGPRGGDLLPGMGPASSSPGPCSSPEARGRPRPVGPRVPYPAANPRGVPPPIKDRVGHHHFRCSLRPQFSLLVAAFLAMRQFSGSRRGPGPGGLAPPASGSAWRPVSEPLPSGLRHRPPGLPRWPAVGAGGTGPAGGSSPGPGPRLPSVSALAWPRAPGPGPPYGPRPPLRPRARPRAGGGPFRSWPRPPLARSLSWARASSGPHPRGPRVSGTGLLRICFAVGVWDPGSPYSHRSAC